MENKIVRRLLINFVWILAIVIMCGLFGILGVNKARAFDNPDPMGSGRDIWRSLENVTGGNYGFQRAVALDSDDYPHLCVYDGDQALKHVYWDGSVWQSESIQFSLVSPNYGRYCSIAIDSSDDIHVSYWGGSLGVWGGDVLKYRKKSNGDWADVRNVDESDETGSYTSIAIDSSDNPHISYRRYDSGNEKIKHAWSSDGGTAWFWENIWDNSTATNVGQYSSIAIDSSDNIHFSYYNNDLYYARLSSEGVWNHRHTLIDNIEQSGRYGTSIAVGSNGIVGIAYDQYGGSGNNNMYYAYSSNAGDLWKTVGVDTGSNSGSYPSLAVDSDNNMHISYRDVNSKDLKYVSGKGNAWGAPSTIDSTDENVGQYSSIAWSNDNAFISYYNVTQSKQDFALVDASAPTGTLEITGKSDNSLSWSLTASDYTEMGGTRYYCVDENNTCDPGTSLAGATVTESYTASSSNVNKIYIRLEDWAGNVRSLSDTYDSDSDDSGDSSQSGDPSDTGGVIVERGPGTDEDGSGETVLIDLNPKILTTSGPGEATRLQAYDRRGEAVGDEIGDLFPSSYTGGAGIVAIDQSNNYVRDQYLFFATSDGGPQARVMGLQSDGTTTLKGQMFVFDSTIR
ncbi:MAG: hypothetical protein HQ538_01085, partial [Parcubacteria group bacterium]|nr:hypothetical protein [Parcubacteria group bacterium]